MSTKNPNQTSRDEPTIKQPRTTSEAILETLDANEGWMGQTDLANGLNAARGTVCGCIGRLEDDGELIRLREVGPSEEIGVSNRPIHNIVARPRAAVELVLGDDTEPRVDIFECICANGGCIAQKGIVERVEWSRATVSRVAEALADEGLAVKTVRVTAPGENVVCLPGHQPGDEDDRDLADDAWRKYYDRAAGEGVGR